MTLKRDGEEVGDSPYPFGVFQVPADDAAYELALNTMKVGQPAAVWKRSTEVSTVWTFRSARDESAYSQGIPVLFPVIGLPEDELKTLPAADGQKLTLRVSGHAGYTPGALVSAKLSYSYDGGTTWTEARTSRQGGAWTASVDHAGRSGAPVTLRTELTDATATPSPRQWCAPTTCADHPNVRRVSFPWGVGPPGGLMSGHRSGTDFSQCPFSCARCGGKYGHESAGEKPAAGDDWWHRLYDESAPDTGPASAAGDTLDDRFDSAADTVGAPPPPDEGPGTWWDPSPLQGGAPPRPDGAPAAGGGPVAATPSTAPRAAHPFPEAGSPAAGAGSAARRRCQFRCRHRCRWAAAAHGPEPGDAVRGGRLCPVRSRSRPDPAAGRPPQGVAVPRPRAGYVGDGPPTYDAEPTALPAADPQELDDLVADTVLDGARYGTFTLRAVSVRGDSARYRGEPRRDALLTARFGTGDARAGPGRRGHAARGPPRAPTAPPPTPAAGSARAVGRSHARLAEDIRAGRRGDLKSGLHRLTDRSFGKLRARAAEQGLDAARSTPPACAACCCPPTRTAVPACSSASARGGLFRLRDGAWQDIEPPGPEADVRRRARRRLRLAARRDPRRRPAHHGPRHRRRAPRRTRARPRAARRTLPLPRLRRPPG